MSRYLGDNMFKKNRHRPPTVLSQQSIFITHSAKDEVLVRQLSRLLETGLLASGNDIFCSSLPGQGLDPGAPIVEGLWQKINSSRVVLFVITKSFAESAFCMCELGAVWGSRRPFIPLLVPPLTYKDLPGVLNISNALDISLDRDLDGLRDTIVDTLHILQPKGGFAKVKAPASRTRRGHQHRGTARGDPPRVRVF